MDDLEKVERLREKADVSYEEAKKALEECGGDLLDAMVYLEKQGKVKKPGRSSYTTQYEEPKIEEAAKTGKTSGGITDMLNRFLNWCGKLIQKGNETLFKVEKDGRNIIRIPVTVFVIVMILTFWILLGVMVVGLFFGCRYSFEGVKKVELDVNKAMDSAADTAEKIKKEFNNTNSDNK